jgi:hypothetical protein
MNHARSYEADIIDLAEGVMVYNHLKEKVKSFLQPFAESGQPVAAEDIKAYFEKLRGDDQAIKAAGGRVVTAGGDDSTEGGNRREQSGQFGRFRSAFHKLSLNNRTLTFQNYPFNRLLNPLTPIPSFNPRHTYISESYSQPILSFTLHPSSTIPNQIPLLLTILPTPFVQPICFFAFFPSSKFRFLSIPSTLSNLSHLIQSIPNPINSIKSQIHFHIKFNRGANSIQLVSYT